MLSSLIIKSIINLPGTEKNKNNFCMIQNVIEIGIIDIMPI